MDSNNVFEKLSTDTLALADSNIEKIAQLFPSCITEVRDDAGKLKKAIRFDVLKELLAGDLADTEEFYEMMFVGKQKARQQAHLSLKDKTLRPCQEESVDWDATQNLYIEGDNLEVMKLMLKGYMGKIKMIYIDPPYNTGKDFVYPDNFSMTQRDYEREAGRLDDEGKRQIAGVELEGARHSDWCRFMYERLYLAKDLLSDDGVIFISIDDNEVDNLKKLSNEIFGESNFVGVFTRVTKKGGKSSEAIAKNHDFLVVLAKDKTILNLVGMGHTDSGFSNKDEFYETRGLYKLNQALDYDSLGYVASLDYPIEINGEVFYAGGDESLYMKRQAGNAARADWGWRWSKALFEFGYNNGFVEVKRGGSRPRIYTKTYQNAKIEKIGDSYCIIEFDRTKPLSTLEFTDNIYSNDNAKKQFESIMEKGVFEYTKPVKLIETCQKLVFGNNFIVMDFFSGSATTAHAVMQLNAEDGGKRKFIMVQIPELTGEKSEAYKAGYKNICEIGKERIRRAGKKIKADYGEKAKDLDIGFRVLKVGDDYKKKVEHEPGEYNQDFLDKLESNIKEDRTDLDLLFACLVAWGVELHHPYRSEKIDGYTVHNYSEGSLVACFDNQIPDAVIRKIAEMKALRVVFRDSGFIDSAAKINVREIFKMISPGTEIRVL